MVWSWSHSAEAYDNVRENIAKLSLEDRKIILAEIATYRYCKEKEQLKAKHLGENFSECLGNHNYFDQEFYEEYLESKWLEILVRTEGAWIDYIYTFASEQAICDNGGFNAYICPFGCHTVGFSKEDEQRSIREEC